MSNRPNMSYCMCENTLSALKQIVNTINEEYEGVPELFAKSLPREEKEAFLDLIELMRDLVEDFDYTTMGERL